MPRGVYRTLEESDLQEKVKELQQRIDHMRRRKKALIELKGWLSKRGLTPLDVLAMYRLMKPVRADRPVKSRKPLQPVSQRSLKNAKKTRDGKRFYITEQSVFRGKHVKFLSPDGQYVWGGMGRKPPWFADHIKAGGLPEDLMLVKPSKASASNGHAQA